MGPKRCRAATTPTRLHAHGFIWTAAPDPSVGGVQKMSKSTSEPLACVVLVNRPAPVSDAEKSIRSDPLTQPSKAGPLITGKSGATVSSIASPRSPIRE